VILSTNVLFGVQSIYQKEKGPTGMYYDYAMASLFMSGNDGPKKILILGNGSGTFATQCKRYFDDVDITGVEIDQKITDLAVEYFELPEDVPVVTYDGRAYLNAIDEKYDVIMVDAYQDITIPFQMSSVEFFQLVEDHLKDDGVMVVNMNMRSNTPGNINDYLADTIGNVFTNMLTTDVAGWSNRILYASNNKDMEDRLLAAMSNETDEDMFLMMAKVYDGLSVYHPGKLIMTDDKAPVELLGMKVIDEIISDEVSSYKSLYEREGLKGLLNFII
jgi:spermidine synthase